MVSEAVKDISPDQGEDEEESMITLWKPLLFSCPDFCTGCLVATLFELELSSSSMGSLGQKFAILHQGYSVALGENAMIQVAVKMVLGQSL